MPENIAFKETSSLNNSPVNLLNPGLPSFDVDNPFTSMIYPFDTDDLEPLSPIFQSLPPTSFLNPFENEDNKLDYNRVESNNMQTLPPLSSMFSTRTTELYPVTSQLVTSHPVMSYTNNQNQNNKFEMNQSTPGMDFVNNSHSLPELNNIVFGDMNTTLLHTQAIEMDNNNLILSPISSVKSRRGNKIGTRCSKPRGSRRKASFPKELGKAPTVNSAFQKLRTLIPTEPIDRRLSKVETLRLAVSYIRHLGHSLKSDSWVEQPCLINKTTTEESGNISTSICTFCMSKKRKVL